MLDVLFPVLETLKTEAGKPDLIARVRTTASEAVARTAPMQATKGRASFLGATQHRACRSRRAVKLRPPACAVCNTLEARQ